MKVALGSDHAGVALKAELLEAVRAEDHQAEDLGPADTASVDYPDYAVKVSQALLAGSAELGVLVCGTGIGMSITANKVKGIRAAVCHTEFEARMARAHNNANVLCLGQRVVGVGLARSILTAFLNTPHDAGRHAKRLEKIHQVEESQR